MQNKPWLGKIYFLVGIMLAAIIFAIPGIQGGLNLKNWLAIDTTDKTTTTFQQLDEDRIQALSIFRARLEYLQTQVSEIDLAMKTAKDLVEKRRLRDSLQKVIQQEVDARKMLVNIQETDSTDWESLKQQIAVLLNQYDPTYP